jgi:hypothetical protein
VTGDQWLVTSERAEGTGERIRIRIALLACVIKDYDVRGKGGFEMKRILGGILLSVLMLSASHVVVQAQETKLPDQSGEGIFVLDKGTFVEVRDRGPGHHSVILYEIVKGEIRIVDAVRVNSDFTKDPPIIRYTRISDIKEQ